jgi:hypothetical protein
MKNYYYLLLLALIFSCNPKADSSKEEKENTEQTSNEKPAELTYIEKLANANGYQNWDAIQEIRFSFNVNNQGKEFKRNWRWLTKDEKVFMSVEGEEVGIDLNKNPDKDVHQAFINDSYWLVFPFQLMWTDGYEYEVNEKRISPINEIELTELVINFDDKGGYTPGDTYKLYIDKEMMIKEWSFFPAGSEEPRISNTWKNYKTIEGVQISTDRSNVDGSFQIYFSDIETATIE